MEISYNELIVYAALFGAAVGLILGLVVFILGKKRGNSKLGLYGGIATFIVGPLSGVLSLIVGAVFLYLIFSRKQGEAPAAGSPEPEDEHDAV